MGHCRLTDFDIMINGYGAPYQVHATYKGHGAGGEFAIDAAQAEWATRLEQLAAGAGPGQPFLEATGAISSASCSRMACVICGSTHRVIWPAAPQTASACG